MSFLLALTIILILISWISEKILLNRILRKLEEQQRREEENRRFAIHARNRAVQEVKELEEQFSKESGVSSSP